MTADQRRAHLDTAAIGTLLACCTVWGFAQVASKVALADIPPLLQSGLRSLGATVLLLAWSHWRRVPMWQRDGTLPAGLLAGLLFAAEFGCMFYGLQFTGASRMVVFLYTAPFVVALGMPFIARGERLSPRQWLGLVLAFGGVAAAFSEGLGASSASPRQWLGDTLGVIAALLWGATTLAIRATRLSSAPAEKTLAYQLAVSALLLLAAAPLAGEAWPQRVGALAASALAFQVVVVTFASYLAWFWLMRHYPATRIASFTLLTPVAGLLFGVLLLGEPLTLRLLIGLAAVSAGLVLVNRR
jgi:drug/metabolite transporter (DMT)-like permease